MNVGTYYVVLTDQHRIQPSSPKLLAVSKVRKTIHAISVLCGSNMIRIRL